jgi:transposase
MGPSGIGKEHGWVFTSIVAEDDGSVMLRVAPTRETVACPTCGVLSRRRHSWYTRRALDLPWRGATARLRVRSRRWFCDEQGCPRKIFAERFEGLLGRFARRTNDATELLVELGLRAGGEGGARLARKVGVPTSPDTLLRLVKMLGSGAAPTPRVLGVDDFSLRRGTRYATVLIDLERHEPIDVLATRDAEPLVEWLQAHPGIEIVVRDRGGAYADAARRGAPNAVQVADRFHLVQNVGAALDEVVRSRSRRKEIERVQIETAEPIVVPTAPPLPPGPAQQRARAARARRVGRWQKARALHADGMPLLTIAHQLGINRKTVRKLVRTPAPPHNRSRPPRPSGLSSPSLQPFVPYLQDRWRDGCHNISQLHRELEAQGCITSRSLLREALRTWLTPDELSARRRHPRKQRSRTRRMNTRWLCLRPPEQLDEEERAALHRVLDEDLPLATAHALMQRFRQVVRDRDLLGLDRWLADAASSELPPFIGFTRGIANDRAAVDAAFTLPWSTGPVEGHVHKIKLLKRQAYGRAGLPQLRARILAA